MLDAIFSKSLDVFPECSESIQVETTAGVKPTREELLPPKFIHFDQDIHPTFIGQRRPCLTNKLEKVMIFCPSFLELLHLFVALDAITGIVVNSIV